MRKQRTLSKTEFQMKRTQLIPVGTREIQKYVPYGKRQESENWIHVGI